MKTSRRGANGVWHRLIDTLHDIRHALRSVAKAPELGRLPTPEEGATTAVISHRPWQDWFGGDPGVIGRSYSIAGEMRTVVGVMPPEFDFPSEDVVLWFPRRFDVGAAQYPPGQFGLRMRTPPTSRVTLCSTVVCSKGNPPKMRSK